MNLRGYQLCLGILLGTACAWAQPVIEAAGVRNSASFVWQGLPNGDIAQGSIFTVLLSSNLPVPNQLLSSYPVPPVFNGASMKVAVGGTVVDVLMFGTAQRAAGGVQLDGILPSSTPIGDGTITVTYAGQTSAPAPIKVVSSSFAWFTANSEGVGPGIFTDLNYQILTPTHAANPGDVVIGWGTGLGPITGDESASALPGPVNPPGLMMWVGGQQVTPQYTGRADSAGEDFVNFQIPTGITGCAVPVILQVGDVVSNTATIPIAASGKVCSDANGFSTTDLNALATKGSITMGSISLSRTSSSSTATSVLNITDSASASFRTVDATSIVSMSGPFAQPSLGTCTSASGGSTTPPNAVPPSTILLDAGAALNINGPAGAKQIIKQSDGSYMLLWPAPYLNPGAYTIDNGTGGNPIGPFTVGFNIPVPFVWTNENSILAVRRSQGLTVQWSGGDPNTYVIISGRSGLANSTIGASFTCTAPTSAGQFTVPPSMLFSLPVGATALPLNGTLSVGTAMDPVMFTGPGLTVGYVSSISASEKGVVYLP
jgi:uncharacterized protein (TIGR03437 family)